MNVEEVKKVRAEIENYFKIDNLFSKTKLMLYVRARAMFYGVMRHKGYSYEVIAKVAGYKAHKTVMTGMNYFEHLIKHDVDFAITFNEMIYRNSSKRELLLTDVKSIIDNLPYLKLKALHELLKNN